MNDLLKFRTYRIHIYLQFTQIHRTHVILMFFNQCSSPAILVFIHRRLPVIDSVPHRSRLGVVPVHQNR